MSSCVTCMEFQGQVVRKLSPMHHVHTLHIGRHCCLWCLITSEQLKLPRGTRQGVSLRSLDTLAHSYSEYLADGANLKRAKFHQNVIGEAFFDVPLSQVSQSTCTNHNCVGLIIYSSILLTIKVCPPGLHITLGIFQRLFNRLEDECHLLD